MARPASAAPAPPAGLTIAEPGGASIDGWIEGTVDGKRWDLAFRSIFNAAPCGLLLLDAEGRIHAANPSLVSMFGYSGDELIGWPVEVLLPHRFRAGHGALREAYMRAPAQRTMGLGRDLSGRRKDGSELPVEIGLCTITTDAGEVACASVIDITERKRFELKLREANAQLEQFTHVASHDLKSPLRGVASLVDFIEEDFGDSPPAGLLDHLRRMRERICALERMIDDLLTYARTSQRGAPGQEIDVAAIVDEIFALDPPPATASITLDITASSFSGARTPFATVLRNLISNAIKHHHAPETMHLAISARDVGEFCVIDISDDGPGIPAAARSRVFRLFQTLSATERKGTGLGLAVAKRLVEGAGGLIDLITSQSRSGCTFRVWWPRFKRSDRDD